MKNIRIVQGVIGVCIAHYLERNMDNAMDRQMSPTKINKTKSIVLSV